MLPKTHSPKTVGDFRPVAIGSSFYRLWSTVRARQLIEWLKDCVGDEMHGGIKGLRHGPSETAGRTAAYSGTDVAAHELPHPAPLRFIGAADLSKAYDRLHESLAAEALKHLGWQAAWLQQTRIFQCGAQVSPQQASDIACLPQGDSASPSGPPVRSSPSHQEKV